MAVVKNMRDAVLKIQDKAGQYIIVAGEVGDLKFEINENINQIKSRGQLYDMSKAEEESVTVSFSLHHIQYLKQLSGADPTVYEALFGLENAAGWISTWNDKIYTTKVIIEYTEIMTEKNEILTFKYFKVIKVSHSDEADSNKIAFEGIDFETKPTIEKAS